MVDGFSARIGNAIATLDPNSANHGALLQIMEEAATSFASVALRFKPLSHNRVGSVLLSHATHSIAIDSLRLECVI